MKKVYYQIHQVLALLVLLRFIIDGFSNFTGNNSNVSGRFEAYAGVIILSLMLYFMTHFDTSIVIPDNKDNLSKFKKFLLHVNYGILIPFLISMLLIAYNILTNTVLITVLMMVTVIGILLLTFTMPFFFRKKS